MRLVMHALMWADHGLCHRFPRLARYHVLVVDVLDGEPVGGDRTRFRWGRTAACWVVHWNAQLPDPASVRFTLRRAP